jgi:hypothetical protein
VETFTTPKAFSANPDFQLQREKSLKALETAVIDTPVVDIISALNRKPCCFTLQSCYGHFLYEGQNDPCSLEPIPLLEATDRVEYRIAYIALCIDPGGTGRKLYKALAQIPGIDPENIQFGSAQWFWERQVNTFALQVTPDRFKHQDRASLSYEEALKVEKSRGHFFDGIRNLI